jgi:dolichol-phosphate mannosyltransferase
MSALRTVIIVPTYNERPNIQKLLPTVAGVLSSLKRDVLLLVVDDSSPDGTAEEVTKLQKKYSFLKLLVNKKKAGLGGAYLKGMDYAFNTLGAEVCMEMDADLSHDPKKIPSFLKAIDDGADLVLGSRYIAGGSIPSNWGLHRKFLSVFGNVVISIILASVAVRDWTTGYRAIRREVYEAVHKDLEAERFSGYTFQIGFLHKALRAGFKVKEVPFHFVDRTIGESKLGTEYIVNTLKYILSVRLQEILNHRLFKFAMVGGVGFLVNLVAFRVFTALQLGRLVASIPGATELPYLTTLLSDRGLAVVLGAEVAILSNYTWSNLWTFKDRRIHGFGKHLSKFAQFNLGSVGSIVIQYLTMQTALAFLGVFTVFTILGFTVMSDDFYLAVGVLIGMIWNFTVYSRVIWRKKK